MIGNVMAAVMALLFTLPTAQSLSAQSLPTQSLGEPVSYTVTFQSTWSQQSHPHPAGDAQFPATAHFSSLIGAIHNDQVTFWAPDTLASPGMEVMAETGGTQILSGEFEEAGAGVLAITTGPPLATTPGSVVIDTITATHAFPLLTLVTMIAPSPDWFVGVADLLLLDDNDQWRDEIIVVLYPYDAGSDDGVDYRSSNVESTPHQLVANIRGESPFSDAPIGTFTLRLQQRWQVYLPSITQPTVTQPTVTGGQGAKPHE